MITSVTRGTCNATLWAGSKRHIRMYVIHIKAQHTVMVPCNETFKATVHFIGHEKKGKNYFNMFQRKEYLM